MAPRKQPKACAFCGIVAETAKAFVVYRDSQCVAFLDYAPLAIGHLLLVPTTHYGELTDVPDEVMSHLAVRLKTLSAAIMKGLDAQGSFIALNNRISQSVPHVHFHIVPRRQGDGLFSQRLIWKRVSYRDDEHRAETAARITEAVGA
jgi:histidine triad (HIT) family protein